mgnify:CR=1 FL=1
MMAQQLEDQVNNNTLTVDQFDDTSYIPVKKLGSAFIAELFHGPTFCFKDLG